MMKLSRRPSLLTTRNSMSPLRSSTTAGFSGNGMSFVLESAAASVASAVGGTDVSSILSLGPSPFALGCSSTLTSALTFFGGDGRPSSMEPVALRFAMGRSPFLSADMVSGFRGREKSDDEEWSSRKTKAWLLRR